ncbi:MAG: DUF1802 family protein [Akkermansiaceae bacterium]
MTSNNHHSTGFHAFKEWQVVCDSLASGKQHLIFRKGGIHEGRNGFSFKHNVFALFPTRFHTKKEHVVVDEYHEPLPELVLGEEISITHVAVAQWAKTLTSWEKVAALSDFHIYSEKTLSDRFHWQGKGRTGTAVEGMAAGSIHVALVRVYKLASPLLFSYEKQYAGCRSWIEIPEYSTHVLEPVIADSEFEIIKHRIDDIHSS